LTRFTFLTYGRFLFFFFLFPPPQYHLSPLMFGCSYTVINWDRPAGDGRLRFVHLSPSLLFWKLVFCRPDASSPGRIVKWYRLKRARFRRFSFLDGCPQFPPSVFVKSLKLFSSLEFYYSRPPPLLNRSPVLYPPFPPATTIS